MVGPLTSELHRDRVMTYLDAAPQEGGTVLAGGATPGDVPLAGGYYFQPTIVETRPDVRAAQEEVFGPFMVVHTFKTDDEALAIANGLA